MMGFIGFEGSLQWNCHMLLPNHVGKSARAIGSIESEGHRGRVISRRDIRPLAHPSEPTYPCCLPALGEFGKVTPYEGLGIV